MSGNQTTQEAAAIDFRARHQAPAVLLLPNVWDPLSAKLFAGQGFCALATTSAGLAWALGYADGEKAPWSEVVAATRRIVEVAQVPVTADIEGGYGDTPDDVRAHVREMIQAGVVGINLEDGRKGVLRDLDDALARLEAARNAARDTGIPIVVNARCDLYYLGHGAEETRLPALIDRCNAYLAAGADCVYPFGLRDPALIADAAKAIAGPINVTGRAGMPDAAGLEKLGVARITIASASTLVAMSAIRKMAEDLRTSGGFDALACDIRHPDAQALFA